MKYGLRKMTLEKLLSGIFVFDREVRKKGSKLGAPDETGSYHTYAKMSAGALSPPWKFLKVSCPQLLHSSTQFS